MRTIILVIIVTLSFALSFASSAAISADETEEKINLPKLEGWILIQGEDGYHKYVNPKTEAVITFAFIQADNETKNPEWAVNLYRQVIREYVILSGARAEISPNGFDRGKDVAYFTYRVTPEDAKETGWTGKVAALLIPGRRNAMAIIEGRWDFEAAKESLSDFDTFWRGISMTAPAKTPPAK